MAVLEEYTVTIGKTEVPVRIVEEKKTKMYYLVRPEFNEPTKEVIREIREIIVNTPSEDIGQGEEFRQHFRQLAAEIVDENLPYLSDKSRDYLLTEISVKSLGLGEIEYLLADNNLEEIRINTSKHPVRVNTRAGGWMKTNIVPESEEEISRWLKHTAQEVGKEVNLLKPRLDATLPNGARVHGTIMPVSPHGNTMDIRCVSDDVFIFSDMIKQNLLDSRTMALLWMGIDTGCSMLIVGGTAAGKTTFLNILLPFIRPNMSIITIEDELELKLPSFLDWISHQTRKASAEGVGEITMEDLIMDALRERPDIIILQEVRSKQDAMTLFEAVHTGHVIYSTFHSQNIGEAMDRLTNDPINLAPQHLDAVDLCVVCFQDKVNKFRRVYQIGEFIVRGEDVSSHILYQWNRKSDSLEQVDESTKLNSKLEMSLGMTSSQVEKEIQKKQEIIEWVTESGLQGVENVGKLLRSYYFNPDRIYEAAANNEDVKEYIKGYDETPKTCLPQEEEGGE